jgi:hypothetical protein
MTAMQHGEVIIFSEILGNVPKFCDSGLKFWDSVPKFWDSVWEIFRPPTDLRALILLRRKKHGKRTFTEPVYYRYYCVSRGHCAIVPRFQVITRRPTCRMWAARWSTDCTWNRQQCPVLMVAVFRIAKASNDDRHGQWSTVNDYSPSQHKLQQRDDEED